MRDILEIILSVLAVFGLGQLIRCVYEWTVFPSRIRSRVRPAVFTYDCGDDIDKIAAYVKTMAREGKISRGGLIILPKSGIIIKDNMLEDLDLCVLRVFEAETEDGSEHWHEH